MMLINSHKGLSLVELLIAMTLGIIILAACIQTYLISKQLSFKQNGLIRIQENARVINSILGETIESSGKIGCNAFSGQMSVAMSSDIDASNMMLLPLCAILGVKIETIQTLPLLSEQMLSKIKTSSDIIAVKNVHSQKPVQYLDLNANLIIAKGYLAVDKGQVIVLSDCAHMLITTVKDFEHTKGFTKIIIASLKEPLNPTFARSSLVGILSSTLYYVADTGRKNATNTAITSLYKTDLNGRTIELVEGVEHMGIYYDMPINKNWCSTSKVSIKMLLTSIEDAEKYPKKYQIEVNDILPSDRLMRMWWNFEWLLKKNHVAQC